MLVFDAEETCADDVMDNDATDAEATEEMDEESSAEIEELTVLVRGPVVVTSWLQLDEAVVSTVGLECVVDTTAPAS